MAYDDPQNTSNPTTGQPILAAWGDIVRDDLEYLARNAPHCRAVRSATQTLTTATWTAILFTGTESFDVGGMHSTASNQDRVTIPAGEAGKYTYGASVNFDNDLTGLRGARFTLNGTAIGPTLTVPSVGFCSLIVPPDFTAFAAGDILRLEARHDKGSDLNVLSATLWCKWDRL